MTSHQVTRGFFIRQWNRLTNFWTRTKRFFCLLFSAESEISNEQQSHTQKISFNGSIVRDEAKTSLDLDLDSRNSRMFYNMNNRRRGIALIFNHEIYMFNFLKRRFGTEKDRDRLKNILELLGFEVIVFENLSSAKIFEELNKVASLNHSDSDCLVITVLTHGSRDSLNSFDGAYSLRDMTKLFNDENCPSLKGKPRLFFIQACRGELLDAGHTLPGQYSYKNTHNRTLASTSVDAIPDPRIFKTVTEEEEAEEEFIHNQPAYNDFLIARSTMIDYASLRNKDTGSWFIQDLCGELESNGTTCSILDLMTRVNWAVTEREGLDFPSGKLSKKKVTLCITTKLLKILQFNKKKELNS